MNIFALREDIKFEVVLLCVQYACVQYTYRQSVLHFVKTNTLARGLTCLQFVDKMNKVVNFENFGTFLYYQLPFMT